MQCYPSFQCFYSQCVRIERENEEAVATIKSKEEHIETLSLELATLREEHSKCGEQVVVKEPEPVPVDEVVPDDTVSKALNATTVRISYC